MGLALDMHAGEDRPGEVIWLQIFDAVRELQRTALGTEKIN